MPSSVKSFLQDSKLKAISAAQAALEKKASDVVVLEVAELDLRCRFLCDCLWGV